MPSRSPRRRRSAPRSRPSSSTSSPGAPPRPAPPTLPTSRRPRSSGFRSTKSRPRCAPARRWTSAVTWTCPCGPASCRCARSRANRFLTPPGKLTCPYRATSPAGRDSSFAPALQPAGADGVGQPVHDDRGDYRERGDLEDQLAVRHVRVEDEQGEKHRGKSLRAEPGDEGDGVAREPGAHERDDDRQRASDEQSERDERHQMPDARVEPDCRDQPAEYEEGDDLRDRADVFRELAERLGDVVLGEPHGDAANKSCDEAVTEGDVGEPEGRETEADRVDALVPRRDPATGQAIVQPAAQNAQRSPEECSEYRLAEQLRGLRAGIPARLGEHEEEEDEGKREAVVQP